MPGRRMNSMVLFPLLMVGYLETLRRAAFQAFGWRTEGEALVILSALVTGFIFLKQIGISRGWRRFFGLAVIMWPGLIAAFSWHPAFFPVKYQVVWKLLLQMPGFGADPGDPLWFGLFSSIAAGLYGLLVFLAARFVAEQKSTTELLYAGSFLMAAAVLAAGRTLMALVLLNLFMGFGLKTQVFLLSLEEEPRNRETVDLGVRVGWGAAGGLLAVLLAGLPVAGLMPEIPMAEWTAISSREARLVLDDTRPQSGVSMGSHGLSMGSHDLVWEKLTDFRLKGEVPLDDRTVMYVKSPLPAYWRGETSDYYTGTGWTRTRQAGTPGTGDLKPVLPEGTGRQIELAFRLAPGFQSEVLFYAGTPRGFMVPGGQVETDSEGNFYVNNPASAQNYQVSSFFAQPDRRLLRHVSGAIPAEYAGLYLQLPTDLPGRVRKLAADLTAGVESPVEKAEIIEQFLSSGFPYTLAVEPVPPGRDVTDFFLFDLKKGYCTYHSTAMVVMLRAVGIPARWVTGFTGGILNRATGEYEVRMKDAHAWVEAFIPGYGWVSFDPTAPLPQTPQAGQPQEVTADTAAPHPLPGRGTRPNLGWLAALLVGVGFSLAYFVLARKRSHRPHCGEGSAEELECLYAGFVQLMARRGFLKSAAQTPWEFAQSLVQSFPAARPEITRMTDAYVRYKYARENPSEREMKELRNLWRKLRKGKPHRLTTRHGL